MISLCSKTRLQYLELEIHDLMIYHFNSHGAHNLVAESEPKWTIYMKN